MCGAFCVDCRLQQDINCGTNVISHGQDIFESMGQFVDGVRFSGGSESLMPKAFIKEVTNMAHKHNVYVSTGDWAEHLLGRDPSSFRDCIEVLSGQNKVLLVLCGI